eukprot:scaffold46438_cov29-Tisochrysis_lutea.AAC.1
MRKRGSNRAPLGFSHLQGISGVISVIRGSSVGSRRLLAEHSLALLLAPPPPSAATTKLAQKKKTLCPHRTAISDKTLRTSKKKRRGGTTGHHRTSLPSSSLSLSRQKSISPVSLPPSLFIRGSLCSTLTLHLHLVRGY